MKSKLLIAIAVLLASSIISAEQGNYILGPIDDAPIEIAVPEVSEDGRPAGVPDGAAMSMFDLSYVGPDIISLGIKQEYLALYGVDAPEPSFRSEDSQPLGWEAVSALRYMLASGTDWDGKAVAYVVRKGWAKREGWRAGAGRYVQLYHATEGYDINASLVCAGYAWWDRVRAPDSAILMDCEAEARREKKGLWSDPNPIAPWDWRKGVRD